MKAVIISCFNYYDHRLKYVEEYLSDNGYIVTYICSDFDHIKKKKFKLFNKNTIQIKTKSYKKNLSFLRIYSHYKFSKKLYKKVNELEPDLIYAMFPPNLVAYYISKYKDKNKSIRLIFDIYDLWPESFPINNIKKVIPFFLKEWTDLRNKSLDNADFIFTECELYQNLLKDKLNSNNSSVLHLTKQKSPDVYFDIEQEYFDVCYLGSINNIIDIQMINKLLVEINNNIKVRLHIIGDGEKKNDFIDEITSSNILVVYYGKIFNEVEKKEIMAKCRFGLNIMKESVSVGLTMKSVDYIEARLPIINNIKADTKKIVNNYKVGFNIDPKELKKSAKQLTELTLPEINEMKINTELVFEKYFSNTAFKNSLKYMFK